MNKLVFPSGLTKSVEVAGLNATTALKFSHNVSRY
jgi:hypothetical protein